MIPETEDVEQEKDCHSKLFSETIAELKHSKAKAKTAFTKSRHALLVFNQQKEIWINDIEDVCVMYDMTQEAMEQ